MAARSFHNTNFAVYLFSNPQIVTGKSRDKKGKTSGDAGSSRLIAFYFKCFVDFRDWQRPKNLLGARPPKQRSRRSRTKNPRGAIRIQKQTHREREKINPKTMKNPESGKRPKRRLKWALKKCLRKKEVADLLVKFWTWNFCGDKFETKNNYTNKYVWTKGGDGLKYKSDVGSGSSPDHCPRYNCVPDVSKNNIYN